MNNKKHIKSVLWLFIAAAIFIVDFCAKRYILNHYTVGETFGSISGITDFVYVQNTGAAFSVFSNNTTILSIISIAFCIAVIVYTVLKKPQHPLMKTALTLLFAGALGNAVDRLAYKFVVDFIRINLFNFPVFNIADISIVAGAVATVLYVILFDKDNTEERSNE